MANAEFLEIELRYKVEDVQGCIDRLAEKNIQVRNAEHLIDEWFLPDTIQSLEEEKDWFDTQHGIAWRIRRASQGDGPQKLDVTSKQLTEASDHNTFNEVTANFSSYVEAVAAMQARAYKKWLTIDKTRYFLASSNPKIPDTEFELIIDEIDGLASKIGIGACLEIEYKGKNTREGALNRIGAVANILGFSSDDQFEKSLTVVSMTELAQF